MLRAKASDIKQRIIAWRREPAIVRLEHPYRLDRAHSVGYKAKQGFVVVRVRVGRGGMRRARPRSGRRPKHLGVLRMRANVSAQEVAQRRAARHFPNLHPLNSYLLYRDGRYAWYEVIFVDPHHPAVRRDRELAWLRPRAP
jgi:large subunit ribosomal protein L15e